MSRPLLILLLAAAAPLAHAQKPCSQAVTTLDINACAKAEFDRVEKRLKFTYQSVLKHLSKSANGDADAGEARKQLVAAQRQWIVFREADCRAIYTLWQAGSIRSLMYLTCMQERARQRTQELGDYMLPH